LDSDDTFTIGRSTVETLRLKLIVLVCYAAGGSAFWAITDSLGWARTQPLGGYNHYISAAWVLLAGLVAYWWTNKRPFWVRAVSVIGVMIVWGFLAYATEAWQLMAWAASSVGNAAIYGGCVMAFIGALNLFLPPRLK
jgi:hypothetical protein